MQIYSNDVLWLSTVLRDGSDKTNKMFSLTQLYYCYVHKHLHSNLWFPPLLLLIPLVITDLII